MIAINIPKKYIWTIDDQLKTIVVNTIRKSGIDEFIKNGLNYIDCTRVKNNMRLMQTIGFPYTYELGRLLFGLEYAFNNGLLSGEEYTAIIKGIEVKHKANLKFEEENPPLIYDKKKKVKNTRASKKKAKEATLEGFEKPKKISAAESKKLNKEQILKNLKFGVVK